MGGTLLGAGEGNKLGHFEDKEFLEFHKAVLKDNRKHMYQSTGHLRFTNEQVNYGKKLITRNSSHLNAWGWKDPRTTIFLDFWSKIEEDIKFLFLYREPINVIDSLFRRKGDRIFYVFPWRAADAWLIYNNALLDFYRKNKEKCLIACISGINMDPENSVKKISNWLGYPLVKPYEDVFRASKIKRDLSLVTKCYRPIIEACRGIHLTKTFDKLQAAAVVTSNKAENH